MTIRSCASKATACTRSPVGPVHAGIIEPGHFRFQVVGEKVLRLEERLGYKHKGIEKRFEALSLVEGASPRRPRFGRQHGRLCLGIRAGPRSDRADRRCRARARVAARAAARARAHRQSSRRSRLSRQRWRVRFRACAILAAERGRAAHQPAAVRPPLSDGRRRSGRRRARSRRTRGSAMRKRMRPLEREIRTLRDIYDDHAGLQDRFRDCGIVTADSPRKLGLIGFAGRASGHGRGSALRSSRSRPTMRSRSAARATQWRRRRARCRALRRNL